MPRPRAFRSGNLQHDENLFKALAHVGIPYSSNVAVSVFDSGHPDYALYSGTHERLGVLASRTQAVHAQLAHLRAMHELSPRARPWGELVTAELIRRHEQELAWLAELGELAKQEP